MSIDFSAIRNAYAKCLSKEHTEVCKNDPQAVKEGKKLFNDFLRVFVNSAVYRKYLSLAKGKSSDEIIRIIIPLIINRYLREVGIKGQTRYFHFNNSIHLYQFFGLEGPRIRIKGKRMGIRSNLIGFEGLLEENNPISLLLKIKTLLTQIAIRMRDKTNDDNLFKLLNFGVVVDLDRNVQKQYTSMGYHLHVNNLTIDPLHPWNKKPVSSGRFLIAGGNIYPNNLANLPVFGLDISRQNIYVRFSRPSGYKYPPIETTEINLGGQIIVTRFITTSKSIRIFTHINLYGQSGTILRSQIKDGEFEKIKHLFVDPDAKELVFKPNISTGEIRKLSNVSWATILKLQNAHRQYFIDISFENLERLFNQCTMIVSPSICRNIPNIQKYSSAIIEQYKDVLKNHPLYARYFQRIAGKSDIEIRGQIASFANELIAQAGISYSISYSEIKNNHLVFYIQNNKNKKVAQLNVLLSGFPHDNPIWATKILLLDFIAKIQRIDNTYGLKLQDLAIFGVVIAPPKILLSSQSIWSRINFRCNPQIFSFTYNSIAGDKQSRTGRFTVPSWQINGSNIWQQNLYANIELVDDPRRGPLIEIKLIELSGKIKQITVHLRSNRVYEEYLR